MPTLTFSVDDPLSTTLKDERGNVVYAIETNDLKYQTSVYRVRAPRTQKSSEQDPKPGEPTSSRTRRPSEGSSVAQPHPQTLTPGRRRTDDSVVRSPPPAYSPLPQSSSQRSRVYKHTPTLSESLSLERSRTLVARITWHLWSEDNINGKITHAFNLGDRNDCRVENKGSRGSMSKKAADEDGMVTEDIKNILDFMGWFFHSYYLLKIPNGTRYKWDIRAHKNGSFGLYQIDAPRLIARFTPSSSLDATPATLTIYDSTSASIPPLLDIFVVSCLFVVRRARWITEWKSDSRARSGSSGDCNCTGGGTWNCCIGCDLGGGGCNC